MLDGAGTKMRDVVVAGDCATGSMSIVMVGSAKSVLGITLGGAGKSETSSNAIAIMVTLGYRWEGSFIIARAKICTAGAGRASATSSGINSGS
jgi:hypothetical protein